MNSVRNINAVHLLAGYVLLNLFKPILGLVIGREFITAISIFISSGLFLYYVLKDLFLLRLKKSKGYSLFLLLVFTLQLILSLFFLQTAKVYPALVSFFQITTPFIFFFVLESMSVVSILRLSGFLCKCLLPFVVFGFLEFLLPIDLRKSLYMYFSFLSTGDYAIDVAYYLGDTQYGGLRLGSLFFEPLTFAFVTSFYTIYLFSAKKNGKFLTLLANVLTLGKLPIATTFVALAGLLFKRLYWFYYIALAVAIAGVLVFFVRNAEAIALTSPSLGSHMLGLAYGLINAGEAPLLGHGFGTAGYLSLVFYLKLGESGPFKALNGLTNGNESAVGVIAYQLGYVSLLLFLLFFIIYMVKLARAKQIMMASGVLGLLLSLFLSESVLSIVVTSVLLIFSKSLMIQNEKEFRTYH